MNTAFFNQSELYYIVGQYNSQKRVGLSAKYDVPYKVRGIQKRLGYP